MRSLMQDVPLTLNLVRERVATLYTTKEVVTRYAHGVQHTSYGDVLARAGQLAGALAAAGVGPGDRVATLAWNSQAHLELYLAVPCMGAVLHTINARLPCEAIAQRLALAGDKILFVDRALLDSLRGVELPATIGQVVVIDTGMAGGSAIDAAIAGRAVEDYEIMLSAFPADFRWPELDERAPSGLCFTSGTTGRPKGVMYSHRSTTLHTLACLFADGIAMRERDVCMPIVPMFHANAWGFPYAALMAGASLALPHRQLDPQSLAALIAEAGVTVATAVPTVWLAFLEAVRAGTVSRDQIRSLRRIPMGGAAVSRALIDGFAEIDIEVTHCWGMTEISPLGLVNVPRSTLSETDRADARSAQGLPIPGCAVRTMDVTGHEAPRDGVTPGELQVRSPCAADGYFDAEAPDNRAMDHEADGFAVDPAGRRWLRTGDIATIDGHGYVRIVDRAKDLIKSGGEWISSQALEARLMEHPAVREAAVVGQPHPTWQERPVAFVAVHHPLQASRDDLVAMLRAHVLSHMPKWQVPDSFVVVADLPKGNTGKIDKAALRASLAAMGADASTGVSAGSAFRRP